MTIEELLERPYWVLDILPAQVPADGPGQYFAVERYYLQEPQLAAIKRKHLDLLLKLNCYRDMALGEEGAGNPPPDQIAEAVLGEYTCILTGDALIVSEPDDTCMTVYNPDEELLRLVRSLAAGEGLFLWQPGAR